MNKKLEFGAIGILAIVFGIFLIVKDGISIYAVLLAVTGIVVLLYSFFKRKEISDFGTPETYDERDELIQNKASNIALTVLTYIALFMLLINSFTPIPLNYALVLLVMLGVFLKQVLIKLVEKLNDYQ